MNKYTLVLIWLVAVFAVSINGEVWKDVNMQGHACIVPGMCDRYGYEFFSPVDINNN